MAKVLIVTQDGFDDPIGYTFKCPGCGDYHCFYVQDPGTPYRGGSEPWPIWTFVNGDINRPTFRASMLHRSGHYLPGHNGKCWCTYNQEHPDEPAPFVCVLCHSFVTDGNIQFLNDSTHALAGQTVELPEVD